MMCDKIKRCAVLLLALALLLSGCGVSQSSYDSLAAERDSLSQANVDLQLERDNLTGERDALQKERDELQAERDALQKDKDALQQERDALQGELDDVKADLQDVQQEYDAYKEETADFAILTEEQRKAEVARAEQERIEAEEAARKAQEEADKAKAEREAEAQRKKEEEEAARLAEEAKGYETGITYSQLARSPDQYKGKKVKFTGKVLQILEGDDENQMRLATKGNYDDVVYCGYDPSILDVRILEDDTIVIYGVSLGTLSYESTMGKQVTLPAIWVDRIELKS